MDLAPLWLSARLALTTTVLLIVFGAPLAWWLSQTRSRMQPVVQAIVAMPIVLPPTVLGFYLLVLLGPRGAVGEIWGRWGGGPLVFSFAGLVIGSVIFSLPFVVRPLQGAFAASGRRPMEAAATLGAGPLDRFATVALPLARRGYLTAATLCFAHTVGEFGVVLMIGGNIPGETRVVSIAIFDLVERMQYGAAHRLSAGLVVFSFLVLLVVSAVDRRWRAL